MSPYKRGSSGATEGNHGLNIIASISHASLILKSNIKLSLTFLIIHLNFPFLPYENNISIFPYRVDHLLLSGQFAATFVPSTLLSQVGRLATVSTLQDKHHHRQGKRLVLCAWTLAARQNWRRICIFTQLDSTNLMAGLGEQLLLKLNFILKQPLLESESREEKPVDLALSSSDTVHLIGT